VEAGNDSAEGLYLDSGFRYRSRRRAGYNAMVKKIFPLVPAEKISPPAGRSAALSGDTFPASASQGVAAADTFPYRGMNVEMRLLTREVLRDHARTVDEFLNQYEGDTRFDIERDIRREGGRLSFDPAMSYAFFHGPELIGFILVRPLTQETLDRKIPGSRAPPEKSLYISKWRARGDLKTSGFPFLVLLKAAERAMAEGYETVYWRISQTKSSRMPMRLYNRWAREGVIEELGEVPPEPGADVPDIAHRAFRARLGKFIPYFKTHFGGEAELAQSLGAVLERPLEPVISPAVLPAKLREREEAERIAGKLLAAFDDRTSAMSREQFLEWMRDDENGFPALARNVFREAGEPVSAEDAEVLVLTVQFAVFIGFPLSRRGAVRRAETESAVVSFRPRPEDAAVLARFLSLDLGRRLEILEAARKSMTASGRGTLYGFKLETLSFPPAAVPEPGVYGFDYGLLKAGFSTESAAYFSRLAKIAKIIVAYPNAQGKEAVEWIRALRVAATLFGYEDGNPVTERKIQGAGLFVAGLDTPIELRPGSAARSNGIHLGPGASRALALPLLVAFVETVLFSPLRYQLEDAGGNDFPHAPDDLAFRLMGMITELIRFAESEKLISIAA
jgi:hypothetical protein